MRFIHLDYFNKTLSKPQDMTDEQCHPVTCYQGREQDSGEPFVLLAIQPSKEDLAAFNRGEPLYMRCPGVTIMPTAFFTINEHGEANV